MSSLNGKQLAYAVLHGTVKVPDSSQVGPTLSAKATPGLPAVKMTIVDDYVKLEMPHKVTKKTITIYVLKSNFSHFQLVDETNSKA